MWASWLAACGGGGAAPDPTYSFRGAVFPEGPGDVIALDVDQQGPDAVLANVEPQVVDASGDEVTLGLRSYLGFAYGWAPPDGWEPGDYVLRGAADLPVERSDPFTVGAFGVGAVDPSLIEGGTWELVSARSVPQDLGPAAFTQGTVAVVVEEVNGASATFSLVFVDADGPDCVVLRDVGDLDASRGALRWEDDADTLVLPGSPTIELEVQDLWLEVEWLEDDPDRAVAQASGSVDTRPLAPLLGSDDGDAACSQLGVLGFECVSCDDGDTACAGIQIVQGSLRRAERDLDPSTLALCGVDRLTAPGPDLQLSCGTPVDVVLDPASCGCSTAGRSFGVPFGLLVLAATRRRRWSS